FTASSERDVIVQNLVAHSLFEAGNDEPQKLEPLCLIEIGEIGDADLVEVAAGGITSLLRGVKFKLIQISLRHCVDFLCCGMAVVIVAQPYDRRAFATVMIAKCHGVAAAHGAQRWVFGGKAADEL